MEKGRRSPPKPGQRLLSFLIRDESEFSVSGDCGEEFEERVQDAGRTRALLWYWGQVIYALVAYSRLSSIVGAAMLKNYVKVTWRNIKNSKIYSFINILGLGVGMACCILILLWVKDESSFDRFHENADVICRVAEHQYNSSGDYFPVAVTPWPLAEALKNEFPEIVESARLRIWTNRLIGYKDKKFYENDFVAVDPSFLNMFSFPLVKGEISTALTEPNSILITRDTAARYFGAEDPMGKVLSFHNSYDFKVTGILENVPFNSHIRFDFLIPFESLREFGWTDTWWTNNYTTYVQLSGGASFQQTAEKVRDYLKKQNPETGTKLILQPLTDIHLRSNFAIDLYGHTENRAIYIYAFSVIALFVLLIACINFMNLSTARSEKRSKEVGLRKVVGASRNNIVTQFYGESLFMTILSFFIAIMLVCLLLPAFNNVSGKSLSLDTLKEPVFLLGLLAIMVVTGFVSGSYPALVQSSFKPVDSIKGMGLGLSSKSRKSHFRRTLVVVQFTLSIILIVGTLIVYKQIDYMLNKKLGYEKESVAYFIKRANIRTQYDAFKSELLRYPAIVGITSASDVPTYSVHSTGGFWWEGKDPETHFLIHQFSVGHDYIKTFNMNIIAGRDFSKEFPADEKTQSFIVNEAAVRAMGLEDPVGTKFTLYGNEGQIIGVVQDFHYKSLQKEIEPLVMRIEPDRDSYVFVKFKSGSTQEALAAVQKVYQDFNPEYPLEYTFLEEAVEHLYDSEEKTRRIFNYFTIIAILISCLGLYGLAAYMAQQKTKEIGIRKVLGASVLNIAASMSWEFILLICVANVAAWPLAYFAMNKWLHNFAYRMKIDPLLFVCAGVVSAVLGLITVGYHTVKSARANPVDSLRYE